MNDIEARLERAGRGWQQSQPPPPDFDPHRTPTRHQTWIPLAVAAAVLAVVAVAVAIPHSSGNEVVPAGPALTAEAVTALAHKQCTESGVHGPWPTASVPVTRASAGNALAATLAGHVPDALPAGFGIADLERETERSTFDGGLATWTNAKCQGVRIYWLTPRKLDAGVAAFGDWRLTGGAGQQSCGDPSPCLEYETDVGAGNVIVQTFRLDRTTAENIVRSVDLSESTRPEPSSSAAPQQGGDIDGDGRPDTVSVQWVHHTRSQPVHGVVRVHVDYASGGESAYDVRISHWSDTSRGLTRRVSLPPWGLTQVNSVGGLEIVIVTDRLINRGPNAYTTYRLLTAGSDRNLQLLPPPARRSWVTGSGTGTGALGYQCNEASLVRVSSVPLRQGYVVRSVTYRWNGTGWDREGGSHRQQHRTGPDRWTCYGVEGL